MSSIASIYLHYYNVMRLYNKTVFYIFSKANLGDNPDSILNMVNYNNDFLFIYSV